MVQTVDYFGRSEPQYHADLLKEASREAVFLMNLAVGARSFQCDAAELYPFAERAVRFLLEHGAAPGWLGPGGRDWTPVGELPDSIALTGARIVELWRSEPSKFDALAFAVRPSYGAP